MAPLVASMIMHAFGRLELEAEKIRSTADGTVLGSSRKKKRRNAKGGDKDGEDVVLKCKADRDVLLILSLVSRFGCAQFIV